MDILEEFTSPGWKVPNGRTADFDRELGRVLQEQLAIIPGDAANEDVWSFLTLVVLPDVAYARFPEMHVNRLLGGGRNVLRRAWTRRHLLGDLTHAGDPPLGEDEYVGLVERSRFARNPRLLRATVEVVLAYPGTDRSSFLRRLTPELVRTTGPLLLDVLEDHELAEHVQRVASSLPTPEDWTTNPAELHTPCIEAKPGLDPP